MWRVLHMHARQGAIEEELIVSDNEKEGNYPKEKIPREESMISQSVSQSLLFYSALLQFVVVVRGSIHLFRCLEPTQPRKRRKTDINIPGQQHWMVGSGPTNERWAAALAPLDVKTRNRVSYSDTSGFFRENGGCLSFLAVL